MAQNKPSLILHNYEDISKHQYGFGFATESELYFAGIRTHIITRPRGNRIKTQYHVFEAGSEILTDENIFSSYLAPVEDLELAKKIVSEKAVKRANQVAKENGLELRLNPQSKSRASQLSVNAYKNSFGFATNSHIYFAAVQRKDYVDYGEPKTVYQFFETGNRFLKLNCNSAPLFGSDRDYIKAIKKVISKVLGLAENEARDKDLMFDREAERKKIIAGFKAKSLAGRL